RPDAGCTRGLVCQCRKHTSSKPQVQPERPGLPCAMALRLIRALPGVPGVLATIARRSSPANLIPASGDQDHTISPSAPAALVSRRLCVHRNPPPTFVTIGRSAPPERAGCAEIITYFGKSTIFGKA